MILKKKAPRDNDIIELERLLSLPLSAKQRFLIELELKSIRSGDHNEQSSAYYIDFKLKDSKNWAIIHDLRIEHRDAVAQIDHLLINRFLEIYVLESKNYYYGVKITDNGEFMAWSGKAYHGIESPIEQNKRHVELLKKTIDAHSLSPKRLGFAMSPEFKSYVLVAPTARIVRPATYKFNTESVVKADAFLTTIEKEIEKLTVSGVLVIAKMISSETLEKFGQKIADLHRPGKIAYAAKLGIKEDILKSDVAAMQRAKATTPADPPQKNPIAREKLCEKCGELVDSKVVFFCQIKKERFGGKILCRNCQKGY